MSFNGHKVKLSVHLEPEVYKAAENYSARMNVPLAVVVADAAKQTLLPQYRKNAELASLKATEKCFNRLRVLEDRIGNDLHVLKEMIGLAVRVYLNHTPAVPDDAKSAATLSGRARFERFLDVLAKNLRTGASILAEAPRQDDSPPTTAEQPRASATERARRSFEVEPNLFEQEHPHATRSHAGPTSSS
jgi:hypothetical protein